MIVPNLTQIFGEWRLVLDGWVVLGVLAQTMFTARFLVQWWQSERAGRSVVPLSFWIFSIAGGFLMLIYAVIRRDPVFIVGQLAGLAVYSRNLVLIQREK
jgi:lipid-A-disaccharide synthase-like uncharacterized protein